MHLPTHEAQRRVDPGEYLKLKPEAQGYWLAILVACQSPGIPVQDPQMQQQLEAIWQRTSRTYQRLLAP